MVDNKILQKDLQQSYGSKVEEREGQETQSWKSVARQRFLDLVLSESKIKLLEVGAGTGVHGAFFKTAGLQVVSTDLSSDMVEACRSKGLEAHQMDFMSLDFEDESFDAVFALNCLLHVGREDLPPVISNLARLIRPNGLMFWGQYGGIPFEGILEDDHYEPKRFFSLLSDDEYHGYGSIDFSLVEFEVIDLDRDNEHFQLGFWRKQGRK